MRISVKTLHQLIFSIYHDPILGFTIQGFVVELNEKGKPTLKSQRVNAGNISNFPDEATTENMEVLSIIDEYGLTQLTKRFAKKKGIKPNDFLRKEVTPDLIKNYLRPFVEIRLSKILHILKGRDVYLSEKQDPAVHKMTVQPDSADVKFSFEKTDVETLYQASIFLNGAEVPLVDQECLLITREDGWMKVGNSILHIRGFDGKKLEPFFSKSVVQVPLHAEKSYYQRFIQPLVKSTDVSAKGFEISSKTEKPSPALVIFNGSKVKAELRFRYGHETVKLHQRASHFVEFECKKDRDYKFTKWFRNRSFENHIYDSLSQTGLVFDRNSSHEFNEELHPIEWVNQHQELLKELDVEILLENFDREYFIGDNELLVEVDDKIDWFDVNVSVRFGEFQIPFHKLAKHIVRGEKEFELPNGLIVIIPKEWFEKLGSISAFADKKDGKLVMKKHHAHIIKGIQKPTVEPQKSTPEISKELSQTLRSYQLTGVNWLYNLGVQQFGACLADDMGLGKTLQTIALLSTYYKKEQAESSETTQTDLFSFSSTDVLSTLICMPSSLIHNWKNELLKFGGNLSLYVHNGANRSFDPLHIKRHHVVLTTYGLVRNDLEYFKQFHFKYLVLDESHIIKNPKSKIAKAVSSLKCDNRISLTGTPIENSLTDLWSQMNFLNPGLLGSYPFFKSSFVGPIERNADEKKRDELKELIAPFILRRTKNEVAKELPPLTSQTIFCEMTPDQRKLYDRVKSKYRNELISSLTDKSLNSQRFVILKGLMELRLIANHPGLFDTDSETKSGKFKKITEMLQNAVETGHNVLVFSQFVKHLEMAENLLTDSKLSYSKLTGSTRKRAEQIKKFNSEKSCKVFLISLKAGGVGLNLTKADYVFMLDPWWNPFAEKQAIDRAYRIGQDKNVFSYKFITEDSIEDKILKLQEKKNALAKDFLNLRSNSLNKLDKGDIQKLFD